MDRFTFTGLADLYLSTFANARAILTHAQATDSPPTPAMVQSTSGLFFNITSIETISEFWEVLWQALCVSCSDTAPGSLSRLLAEVVQLGYPTMQQMFRFAEFVIGQRLASHSIPGLRLDMQSPRVSLVSDGGDHLFIEAATHYGISFEQAGLGDLQPVVAKLHAAIPDSIGPAHRLKFNLEKNFDERIGAVTAEEFDAHATTNRDITVSTSAVWDVTEFFSRGTRLDTITDPALLPEMQMGTTIKGNIVSRFAYLPEENRTYMMTFPVNALPARVIEREFAEGNGTVAWETEVVWYMLDAQEAAPAVTSVASADVTWEFLINGNYVDVFIQDPAINHAYWQDPDVRDAVVWMVDAECQADLVVPVSSGVLEDIRNVLQFVRSTLGAASEKQGQIQTLIASFGWDDAALLVDVGFDWVGQLLQFLDQLADNSLPVLQLLRNGLVIDLAQVSSALGDIFESVLAVELCGYSTATDFNLRAKVTANIPRLLTMALGSSTFGQGFPSLPNVQLNNATASLSFVASYSRPTLRTHVVDFQSAPVCDGTTLDPTEAAEEILQMPGAGWRFVAGALGTFSCQGQSITFKKTSDDDLTVELMQDASGRDTLTFDLTVANPVGLVVTECTTGFKVGHQDVILPLSGEVTDHPVQVDDIDEQHLAIILGGGKCDVTLTNIKFFAASVGSSSAAAMQINSVDVMLTGAVHADVGPVTVDIAMENFGARITFDDEGFLSSPAIAETNSSVNTTAPANTVGPRIAGIGSLKGRVALAVLPDIFAGLDVSSVPAVSVAFQKLGDADFDFFYDVDLSALAAAIIALVRELKHLNVGLPDLIDGTRATTMPVPRVIDFSSVLDGLSSMVETYFGHHGLSNVTNDQSQLPPTPTSTVAPEYPTLSGLAEWVVGTENREGTLASLTRLAGSIRYDPNTARLVLRFDVTTSLEVDKTFAGTDDIASTCNSLYEQVTAKAKYANVFKGVVNISKFQGGNGCGRVTVEGKALLRAVVELDFQKMLALNSTAASAAGPSDTADVITTATVALHPDTRFEVDVVAQPDIPFLETDIRLHFLAHMGDQEDSGPLRINDLLNRSHLLRYLRGISWTELSGRLDATFKARIGVGLEFLGMDQEFQFEPVLSLSSGNLLARGFGLKPLIDIGMGSPEDEDDDVSQGSSSDAAEDTAEDMLLQTVTNSTLDQLESLIGGVGGLDVPDLPSFFEPLQEGNALKIGPVARAFKKVWAMFAKYRKATQNFIKLRRRYALRAKVMQALESLIFLVTGIKAKANPTYLLALAHDVFGMLLKNGAIPSIEEAGSLNPYSSSAASIEPPSKLSQYHLESIVVAEKTDEDRVITLLNKVLPRQFTLRGLFSFCMRYIKTALGRLAHKGQLAALDAWKKYHHQLNQQFAFAHTLSTKRVDLTSSAELDITANENGMLVVDAVLSLQTVVDITGLLSSINDLLGNFVTSSFVQDTTASELLDIAGGQGAHAITCCQADLLASVGITIRVAINTTALLLFDLKSAFELSVANLTASAGAVLRAKQLTLSFGGLVLDAEMDAAINVYGASNVTNTTDAVTGFEQGPILEQLKSLWGGMHWGGDYTAGLNVTLVTLPEKFMRFFPSSNTASVSITNKNLFPNSGSRRSRRLFGFEWADFIVVVKNIEFPSCEQQTQIAAKFLDSIGVFTAAVAKAGNTAIGAVANENMLVLGQNANITEALSSPSFATSPPTLQGGMIDLQDTFNELQSTLGVEVFFCVTPHWNENLLHLQLSLELSAGLAFSTPNLGVISQGTKDALGLTGITAAGAFDGDVLFYLDTSLIVNVGALPENVSNPGLSTEEPIANTTSISIPPNRTLLHIAAGFRANAYCALQVSKNGEPFLNGSVSLRNAGFDVLFPFGGRGAVSDIFGSLASTKISKPTGNLSAGLSFDPSAVLQIGALADLGLSAPKFLLSLDDANVFSDATPEEKMIVTVDFDVTEFKQYILSAMQKIADIEFGFDVAGIPANMPISPRGLLQDLSGTMQTVYTATVDYFHLCESGSVLCGRFGYPTLRGLFAVIKDAVMGDVKNITSATATVVFGNDIFTVRFTGGYDVESRELSVDFHLDAHYAKESSSIAQFFGTADDLLSRVSHALPAGAASNPGQPQTAVFDGIPLYLKVHAVVAVGLKLDFSSGNASNATDRCTRSRLAIGPESKFSVAFGAKPFSKVAQVGPFEFQLQDALADVRLELGIADLSNNSNISLETDFCSLTNGPALKSFVSAVPWYAKGSFLLESKLGVSMGAVSIMPVISIENTAVFDSVVSATKFTVDFDLSDLSELKDLIRTVLAKISEGVQSIFGASMQLNGNAVNLNDALLSPASDPTVPNLAQLFDGFWTLFNALKAIKAQVPDATDGPPMSDVCSEEFANALLDALTSNTPLYDAIVNMLKKVDLPFVEAVNTLHGIDLTVLTGVQDEEKIQFILSALGCGPQDEEGVVAIVTGDQEKSVPVPRRKDNSSGPIMSRGIWYRLRKLRFPTIRSLLKYLNDVAFDTSVTKGPFSLDVAFANQVLKLHLAVDWSLDASTLIGPLKTHMASITSELDPTNTETAFICGEATEICANAFLYPDYEITPSIKAGITAVLNLSDYVNTRAPPDFSLKINYAQVEVEAYLTSFSVPIVTNVLALENANLYLQLGTAIYNVTVFDTAVNGVSGAISAAPALAQAAANAYGSFNVELPFAIGPNTGLVVGVGIYNDDVTNLANTKFELLAIMGMPLLQELRDMLEIVSDLGRNVNGMAALNRRLPVLGVTVNEIFVKAGPEFGRQGWGDFLIWDSVLDDLLTEMASCQVNSGIISNACEVGVTDLLHKFKSHARDLLTMPNLHLTGGVGGGSASLSASFDAVVRVQLDPHWDDVFDNLPVKFRAHGALELVLTIKGGFDFSADVTAGPVPVVSNVQLTKRPFEVALQLDAEVDVGIIFGILEGTVMGDLNVDLTYTNHASQSLFEGSANAYLEIDASLNGLLISDVIGVKPSVAIDVPDLNDPADVTVTFSKFKRLRDFIQLTPETLLLMLRALDKFLQDYTNSTLFQTKLPMLDITLKDVLDFTAGFEQRISARLQEPRPVKNRLKKDLILESENCSFPYEGKASTALNITLDEDVVQFVPFSSTVLFNTPAALVAHLNAALLAAEADGRVQFKYNDNETRLELWTTPNTTLVLVRMSSALPDALVAGLADPGYINFTLTEKEADDAVQEAELLKLLLFFQNGVEDLIPMEPSFTTWKEFAVIIFEELGEILELTSVPEVTFENVNGHWELLFDLRIPFGFTKPAEMGLQYDSGTSSYVSAGIDADITLHLTPSADFNFVRVAFGARFGMGQADVSLSGRLPQTNGGASDIATFAINDPITMDIVVTTDSLVDGTLEVNKTLTMTVPAGNFFNNFQAVLLPALASIGETGAITTAFDDEGFLVTVENVRKLDIAISPADKEAIGLGLTTLKTPFFQPIFHGLEFNAKSSLVAEINSAHLKIGGVFDIRTENGRGNLDLQLRAAVINPLPGRRNDAISLNELQTYLRSENGSLGDMLEASATVSGGISLTNIKLNLGGIPVNGWVEVDQDDIVLSFDAGNRSIVKGELTVTSSLDQFDLKRFGLCDILKLISMAVELFDGDDQEPGGLLHSIGEWELPFMDVTIGDILSFIGDGIDLLQAVLDDPAGSLEKLNEAISTAIGTDFVVVEFGLDTSNTLVPDHQVLTVTISISGGVHKHFAMSLDLEDLIGDAADSIKDIVDVGITGSIDFEAEASAVIKLGVAIPARLTPSCDGDANSTESAKFSLIVYDETALSLDCRASASGSINAQVGPIQIGFDASLSLGKAIGNMDEAVIRFLRDVLFLFSFWGSCVCIIIAMSVINLSMIVSSMHAEPAVRTYTPKTSALPLFCVPYVLPHALGPLSPWNQ